MLLNLLRYKYHQWRFCKEYIKRTETLPNYELFLKHVFKKDTLRGDFISVSLYDVLDNNGMNKLIKRLYRLKKDNQYNVSTHYITRRFRRIDYISSNINSRSVGLIATVKLKDNKWISKIEISYTYVNNSEVIVEYCFCFKNVMRTYLQRHRFVKENILSVKRELYFHSYADQSIIKKANCCDILEADSILFADILQAYICELFYTRYGKHYKLPIEFDLKGYKYNKRKAKKLKKCFLCECYQKDKKHLIVNRIVYKRYEAIYYCAGKTFPHSILLRYFTDFPTEMYYKVFYDIEVSELEKRMRKYLNSRKNFVSAKDIKWFVNKIRYIREQEEKIEDSLKPDKRKYIESLVGWRLYIHGKLKNKDFINYPDNTAYFEKLYKQNLEYLNSISAVQNNVIVIIVAVATLFATILGIIITLCG